MRRAFPLILRLLVVAVVVVASIIWVRDHERDGRSPYEKVFGDESPGPSVSFVCFPRRPEEGEVTDLNETPKSDDAIVPGEPERLLLCRYWGLNYETRSLRLAEEKARHRSGNGSTHRRRAQ